MCKNILILIMGMFLFSACGNQLNIYPHSAASSDNISEEDLDALLNGMYNRIQNAPGDLSYIMFDLIGGNLINAGAAGGGNFILFVNGILRPEQSIISTQWNGYYKALYQTNTVLDVLKSVPSNQKNDEIAGVAHFFRGYIYYNLVTRWGAVPILKDNTQDKVSRNPVDEVWAFIEEELTKAISQCPSYTGDYYYVSKEAAKALMARVKLAEGKKQEAAQLAEEMIQSGLFHLDQFSKIFRGEKNKEEIFAFRNLTLESSVNLSNNFYTYAHPVKGSYWYKPTNEVMNLYEAGDNRADISIDTYQGLNVINKYPSGKSGTDPLVIIRLAEMYLISAEAQGLDGLDRLNELRAARNLSPVHPTNETAYMDAILLARRREFLAEGYRWYDLVRVGRAKAVLGITDAQLKLPLPEKEVFLNDKLKQNTGY